MPKEFTKKFLANMYHSRELKQQKNRAVDGILACVFSAYLSEELKHLWAERLIFLPCHGFSFVSERIETRTASAIHHPGICPVFMLPGGIGLLTATTNASRKLRGFAYHMRN